MSLSSFINTHMEKKCLVVVVVRLCDGVLVEPLEDGCGCRCILVGCRKDVLEDCRGFQSGMVVLVE